MCWVRRRREIHTGAGGVVGVGGVSGEAISVKEHGTWTDPCGRAGPTEESFLLADVAKVWDGCIECDVTRRNAFKRLGL